MLTIFNGNAYDLSKSSGILHLAKDKYLLTAKELANNIARGRKREYICYSIMRVRLSEEISNWKKCQQLQERIANSVEPHLSVKSWIRNKLNLAPNEVTNIQFYRHRWVQALIEEYKKKGD